MKRASGIIIGIVVLLIFAGGAIWFFQGSDSEEKDPPKFICEDMDCKLERIEQIILDEANGTNWGRVPAYLYEYEDNIFMGYSYGLGGVDGNSAGSYYVDLEEVVTRGLTSEYLEIYRGLNYWDYEYKCERQSTGPYPVTYEIVCERKEFEYEKTKFNASLLLVEGSFTAPHWPEGLDLIELGFLGEDEEVYLLKYKDENLFVGEQFIAYNYKTRRSMGVWPVHSVVIIKGVHDLGNSLPDSYNGEISIVDNYTISDFSHWGSEQVPYLPTWIEFFDFPFE
jgi:hypothetical protein